MKLIIKSFLVMLVAIQFSCGEGNQTKEKQGDISSVPTAVTGEPGEKPFANIHFASRNDTSCGMPLTAGIEDTVHLNDKIYGFCSKGCKEDFVSKLTAERKR